MISKKGQNLEISLIPAPYHWEKHSSKKWAIIGNDTLIYGFLSFTEAEKFINKYLL